MKKIMINSCRYCRKLFRAPVKSTVCSECTKKDEELFEKIRSYLLCYPNSNAMQIADGLDVNVMEIVHFIDEGRLSVAKGSFSKITKSE